MPVTPRFGSAVCRSAKNCSHLHFAFVLVVLIIVVCGRTSGQNKAGIDTLIRQGKLSQAEQQLERSLKQNPRDARTLNLLGTVRLKQGKFVDAEKQFAKAIAADPKLFDAYSNLGSLCADEGRLDDSIAVYEKLLELQSTPRTKAALATLYERIGQHERSMKLIEQIPPAARTSKLLPVMAANYIGLNQADKVKPAIGEVLRKSSADPDVVPQLATIFLQQGHAGDALELLNLAGPHQKHTAKFLGVLAKTQLLTGKVDEAKAAAQKAIALNPKNVDGLFVLARFAGSAGEWTKAVELMKRVVVITPPTSESLQSLVYASMQIDDLQTAHNAALDFRSMWPESQESALVLSAVLVRASHWGEAKPLLESVLAQSPDDKRALLAMGIVEYNLGNMDAAKPRLTASLGQEAGDAEAHYVLGLVEKQLGDIPAATIQMEAAVRLNPAKAEALSSLGQFYLQQNELPKARAMLEQAVAKLPVDSQNRYQLAQVYRKLGMTDKAREQMDIFQKLSARNVAQPVGETAK
jgi:tetratricopeptide (TPR) repeat protein